MLDWKKENISQLGKTYLRTVLEHMRGREESTVRFGRTGQGIAPNYEVTLPNGTTLTYLGLSHNRSDQIDSFDSANTSRPFTVEEVTSAYQRSS